MTLLKKNEAKYRAEHQAEEKITTNKVESKAGRCFATEI